MQPAIRPAAVAGTFYPRDPDKLRAAVSRHLAAADAAAADGADRPPKLLVAPHAGYVYSGDVAALAYAPLARWRGRITRIVLLGPVHRVAVQGLSAPTVNAFETPLGVVPLDSGALHSLGDLRQVAWSDVRARRRALSGGAAAVLAERARRRFHAGAAGSGPRPSGRRGRGARAAVGRRRDADRDQLRPVALPALRAGAGPRPRHRAAHPAVRQRPAR